MCGEKSAGVFVRTGCRGSPPRVRGKGSKKALPERPKGITPACAGKRLKNNGIWRFRRDHPRVCGEKCHVQTFQSNQLGSPPRVRGKGLIPAALMSFTGITPACAGKSLRRWKTDSFLRDHPRVCGEKHFPHGINITLRGSPPRVRGKALSKEETPITDGITPACAGKRAHQSIRSWMMQDHPRVCGEK